MKSLGYLIIFLFPAAVLLGVTLGGWATLTGFGVAFLLLPVLDALVGLDTQNPPPEHEGDIEQSRYFRAIPLAWVPVQLGMIGWTVWVVAKGTLGSWEMLGLMLSLGAITGGIGITVAHELGHKRSRLDRVAARVLLASVSYTHFFIEHNRGHHVKVATPEDPATAMRGQGFWGFFPATVFRQWCSAWKLEARVLRSKDVPVISRHNAMVWYTGVTVGVPVLVTTALGWQAALFFLGQSAVAVTLLEAVNYVEHYGLERKKIAAGRYERVTPLHSWNASYLLTNWVLLGLQRHSDHHAHGTRRYPALRHHEDSPQLPAGYPTMVLLAFVPPLWRRVMDPRLGAHTARVARTAARPT